MSIIPKVLAHMEEATSSAAMEQVSEEGERNFGYFMGDMMNFHWGGWSPLFIVLWWVTWVLVVIALIFGIVWLWKQIQRK